MTFAAVVVLGYLLGSCPWGYWLVRLIRHEDIRKVGSGNIGATNVWRTYGRWLGVPVVLLDMVKGFLPALLGMLFAVAVTVSVQLVGLYLVFATLIVPPLATRRMTRGRLPARSAASGAVPDETPRPSFEGQAQARRLPRPHEDRRRAQDRQPPPAPARDVPVDRASYALRQLLRILCCEE